MGFGLERYSTVKSSSFLSFPLSDPTGATGQCATGSFSSIVVPFSALVALVLFFSFDIIGSLQRLSLTNRHFDNSPPTRNKTSCKTPSGKSSNPTGSFRSSSSDIPCSDYESVAGREDGSDEW
jgi:hypothetical protein